MTQATGAESSTPQSNLSSDDLNKTEAAVLGVNPHVFRVAKEVLDSEAFPSVRIDNFSPRTTDELIEISPSFREHAAIMQQPFAASYLRLDKVYSSLEPQEKYFLNQIDGYITHQLKEQNLLDSTEAATGIVEKLEKQLGLTPQHDPYYRAERLARFIKPLSEQNEFQKYKADLAAQRPRNEQGQFI